MGLKKIIIENGEMNFNEKFISVRILKESLLKQFRLKVIEESTKCLSCRIYRMARLFGIPVPFPNPLFNLEIVDENDQLKIKYEFISYDYYIFVSSAVCFLVLAPKIFGTPSLLDGISKGLFIFFGILLFGYVAIKLDSKYFIHLIRKNLRKNIVDV